MQAPQEEGTRDSSLLLDLLYPWAPPYGWYEWQNRSRSPEKWQRLKQWRDRFQDTARAQYGEPNPFRGPVWITLVFCDVPTRARHHDLSNYYKVVEDALTDRIYRDDKQVVRIDVRYASSDERRSVMDQLFMRDLMPVFGAWLPGVGWKVSDDELTTVSPMRLTVRAVIYDGGYPTWP